MDYMSDLKQKKKAFKNSKLLTEQYKCVLSVEQELKSFGYQQVLLLPGCCMFV